MSGVSEETAHYSTDGKFSDRSQVWKLWMYDSKHGHGAWASAHPSRGGALDATGLETTTPARISMSTWGQGERGENLHSGAVGPRQ